MASGSIEMQRILLARSLLVGMNIELSDEATEYGLTARKALESAGGDLLAQLAEAEPDRRGEPGGAGPGRTGRLGPGPARPSADELEAAAALCRSAGYWALAYPVAERLRRPPDVERRRSGRREPDVPRRQRSPASTCAGWPSTWTADGASPWPVPARLTRAATPSSARSNSSVWTTTAADDVALGLVLPCWTLLGMLDRAIELTRDYVLERQQFGQPLLDVPRRAVPADRRRGRAGRARGAGQVRPVEHRIRPPARRSTTRWRCGWPPSRRPTSCSGSPTSCTGPSASATRPRCRGCPVTACPCAGCPSAHRPPGLISPGVWADRDCPACSMSHPPAHRRTERIDAEDKNVPEV